MRKSNQKRLLLFSRIDRHKPLIEVTHLSKEFPLGRGQTLKAVNDLSFYIYPVKH